MTIVRNRAAPDNHGPKHRSRVFICDDKFVDIRKGLLQRGWSSNPVLGSPAYDFKWRNYCRINFRLLRSTQASHSGSDLQQWIEFSEGHFSIHSIAFLQVVNHLFNAIHLSSKALVACHLQGSQRLRQCSFFPRSWLPFRSSHIISLLNYVALFRSYSQLCACATGTYKSTQGE